MNEVIPGIFQMPLPNPNPALDHVNSYLVRGDSECLLIDTGWNTPETLESLKDQLAEIGVRFEDVSQIVVTHLHPDHYGLVHRLKALSPAKITLHHLEFESRYIDMDDLLRQVTQRLHINGVPAEEMSQQYATYMEMTRFVTPTPPDISLRGGETINCGIFSFKVLWTPGHAMGHICLYEPQQRVLISGDHILPHITPNIALHPRQGPDPLHTYLNSLDSMRELAVRLILPGHEYPFGNLKQRIEEIIQHHRERNLEILKTLNTAPKTAYQIATEITWRWDTNGVGWDYLGPLNKRMAVLETMSHLEAMRTDGKLDKSIRDEVIYYQRKAKNG